jgi:hypothetical protein
MCSQLSGDSFGVGIEHASQLQDAFPPALDGVYRESTRPLAASLPRTQRRHLKLTIRDVRSWPLRSFADARS